MADKTLVFFQTLLNTPSISYKQRKKILKIRKDYLSNNIRVVNSKKVLDEITEEELYMQPANVAKLLSKFDEGKEYGIILHPDINDETAFANSINYIQKRLIEDISSTSIPKTLKALLFVFVLGKYGTYTEWIAGGGVKHSITCVSKQVKELCMNAHPLHIKEISDDFEQFYKAITVNEQIMNKILDLIEIAYSGPITIFPDSFIGDLDNNKQKETFKIQPNTEIYNGTIPRIFIRSNLDKVFFHTYTKIFYSAMVWFAMLMHSYGKLFVSYEEINETSSIIIKHNWEKGTNADNILEEIKVVKKAMSSILAGYAEVTVDTDIEIDDLEFGPKRLFLVELSSQNSEKIECVDNDSITYRLNFFKY